MVHKESSEGSKYKPRGRPFPKGNKRGKLENKVLATSGRESGVEGGVIAPALKSAIVDPANDGIFHQLPKLVKETIDNTLKECMETKEEVKEEHTKKEVDELEIVETVEFKNGDNILSLRFSKLHNRSFRIQVFLNNENEIRPVTYTGARTGYAFWNLLKGALKK
jgi:hypothetical protein